MTRFYLALATALLFASIGCEGGAVAPPMTGAEAKAELEKQEKMAKDMLDRTGEAAPESGLEDPIDPNNPPVEATVPE